MIPRLCSDGETEICPNRDPSRHDSFDEFQGLLTTRLTVSLAGCECAVLAPSDPMEAAV